MIDAFTAASGSGHSRSLPTISSAARTDSGFFRAFRCATKSRAALWLRTSPRTESTSRASFLLDGSLKVSDGSADIAMSGYCARFVRVLCVFCPGGHSVRGDILSGFILYLETPARPPPTSVDMYSSASRSRIMRLALRSDMRAFLATDMTDGQHSPVSEQKSASASKTRRAALSSGPLSQTSESILMLTPAPFVLAGACVALRYALTCSGDLTIARCHPSEPKASPGP
jgi:hypothetical protein